MLFKKEPAKEIRPKNNLTQFWHSGLEGFAREGLKADHLIQKQVLLGLVRAGLAGMSPSDKPVIVGCNRLPSD